MTDLRDTDFDPMATLLKLLHDVEQLEYHNERIIEHINNQASIIHQQARVMEDMFHRLQQLEEQHEK